MSDEERRSKFRQALDDAADKIGIKTIWSDALEQHKALEEAERRGEERGAEGMFRAMLTLDGLPWSDKPIHPSWVRTICIPPKKAAMKAFDDWRASEEYREGK